MRIKIWWDHNDKDNKATDIIEMMGCIKNYQNMGTKRLIYKAIPSIYQSIPSEEDRYAIYTSLEVNW